MTINENVKCLWKQMADDPESSTFEDVREETHSLYKCYDCLGVGMNVCEDYAPKMSIFLMHKVTGDYLK